MPNPSVYIETTIFSYLASRPSRDIIIAGHQQITHEWWKDIRPQCNCYISEFVVQEIERGNTEAANQRLIFSQNISVLQTNEEIQRLSEMYFKYFDLPSAAKTDASHLAMATWYNLDYVISWNCKHIASGRVQKILSLVNTKFNLHTPILCTPEELMEL